VTQKPHEPSLDFLNADPVPVEPGEVSAEPARTLPPGVVDDLMRLDGVDGVWVEQDPRGTPVVIVHYSHPGPASHLPTRVLGMPIRVVGGEPIRAY
jgi:hypothetical protein